MTPRQTTTPKQPPRPTPTTHNIAPALLDAATPIDDLHPHPRNARKRDKTAEHELRESLRVNGQYRRVVARRLPDGQLQLLAGHGTTEQARRLGWTHVAAEIHDGMDDDLALRIVLVDNRTSDLAGYDFKALLEAIDLLPDLEGSGWTGQARAELLATLEAKAGPAKRTDPDAHPPVPETPISQLGDLWELGPHRLVVGDGTDHAIVALALDDQPADLYLSDPPYNVDYEGGTADALKIENDAMSPEEFEAFLGGLFDAAIAHTKPGGPAYIFHADSAGLEFRAAFRNAGWSLKQVLVWAKDHLVLGRQDHHWQHEPILYGWRPGAAHAWYGGRTLSTVLDDQPDLSTLTKAQLLATVVELFDQTTVIRHPRPQRNREHPTMKPVSLLERLIARSTRLGDLVLDTCAGSGSTLIACHATSRRAAVVELDPRYADVICRRYQEHTGITPLRDGQPVDFTRAVA